MPLGPVASRWFQLARPCFGNSVADAFGIPRAPKNRQKTLIFPTDWTISRNPVEVCFDLEIHGNRCWMYINNHMTTYIVGTSCSRFLSFKRCNEDGLDFEGLMVFGSLLAVPREIAQHREEPQDYDDIL